MCVVRLRVDKRVCLGWCEWVGRFMSGKVYVWEGVWVWCVDVCWDCLYMAECAGNGVRSYVCERVYA